MRLPAFTFLLMSIAAGAILATGTWMARRNIEERVPVDRAVLREFADALDGELSRLQDLYEQDLIEVSSGLTSGHLPLTRERCSSIYGIRSCTYVPLYNQNRPVSVPIPTEAGDRIPSVQARLPGGRSADPTQQIIIIDPNKVSSTASVGVSPTGWIHQPRSPFSAFWIRNRSSEVLVLIIDWRLVTQRTNMHLRQWLSAPYAAVRATGDNVALEGPGSSLLAGLNSIPSEPADFVFPLRKRQGEWQIVGWDRTRFHVRYDLGIFGIAATVSGVLLILGFILYRHQRDALRLAEARVSFVNRVSHELGTPLTNMLLNLDLADEQLRAKPEAARQHLSLVTQEAERLSRLVRNVLTFSKAERDDLQLDTRLSLPDEIILAVLKQFEPALARRNVTVEWAPNAPMGIMLDPDALAQIVSNLISNVEKYAAKGKWLKISTGLSGETFVVRVADAGPGIPTRDRERVFRPFERVHSSLNEGASGTGLGLAIAGDLARRMGGSLDLLPSDQGALFELRLPARQVIASLDLENPAA